MELLKNKKKNLLIALQIKTPYSDWHSNIPPAIENFAWV